MTKKTAIKALHTSTLFGVYSRRDEVVEARGHNFTTCTEWLDAHFGKNNVYPHLDADGAYWEIYVELERGVIWCHA